MEKEIEKKVMNLERKPLDELRKMWKKVYGEEAPKHSKKYLIPRLAYRIQEEAYGEMSRKGAKRLDYLADRLEKGKRISSDKLPVAGTELILEPVHNLFRSKAVKARTTICRLVLSFRSQFFHNLLHFSNQAKDRSTTYNAPHKVDQKKMVDPSRKVKG